MPTNTNIDEETRLAQLEQLKILTSFGTVDFDASYDYKAERRMRSILADPEDG